jgi:ATP-dependent RNA helicase RhlE
MQRQQLNTFESMDLFAPLKRALAEQNYETPTPIQSQTIPPAVAGQDILGCAQTGTGKTAAFALPILDYLGHEKPRAQPNRPIALVLAPTRELAIQIGDSFRVYGRHIRFRQALVYGGVGQGEQVRSLRAGAEVLVATPGRLLDLMEQGHIDLRNIEVFVLDEADRMLDMGFMPALKKIIAALPEQRQSLFFSATLPAKIRELSGRLLFNPVSIDVTPKTTSLRQIQQQVKLVDRGNKLGSLRKLLDGDGVDRTIVFTRTKHGANGLAKKLEREGVRAVAIHGNKTQNARQRALEAFRRKQVTVLVATDVAARGIDIDGVTHVVNYDMPVEPESYIHRIGRTGRAGAEGIAISFCTSDERDELRAIESLIGQRLDAEDLRTGTDSRDPKKRGEQSTRGGRPSNGRRGSNNARHKSSGGIESKRTFRRGKKSVRKTGAAKRPASVA